MHEGRHTTVRIYKFGHGEFRDAQQWSLELERPNDQRHAARQRADYQKNPKQSAENTLDLAHQRACGIVQQQRNCPAPSSRKSYVAAMLPIGHAKADQ